MIGPDTLAAVRAAAGPDLVVLGAQLAAPTDVFVPEDRVAVVSAALEAAGFVTAGWTTARFDVSGVEALRITTHRQLAELLEASVEGRPAPRHELLLCAERLVSDPGVETALVADLARQALDADPGAWAAALKRGLDWGLWRALAHLERALGGATVTSADRADALAELRAAGGAAVRQLTPVTIALSGVDGAGKSMQARELSAALGLAGIPAAVEWARLAADRRLDLIAQPVARVASRLRGRTAAPDGAKSAALPLERAAARSLRNRSPVVNAIWAYIVISVTVGSQRRVTRLHARQGRTVVRDRYLIDAVVQLRDDYGMRCGSLARAALRLLAPHPLLAVLLSVAPQTALARKREQYVAEDLRRLSDRYRIAASELGVHVVDGERDPATISRELFAAVWQRLAQTNPARRESRTG